MNACILIIGNEILSGRTRDANGHFLTNWLNEFGITTKKLLIVEDDLEQLSEVFSECWSKYPLIITTGGLGPTKDDLTKGFFSQFFNKKLESNKEAIEITKKQYSKIKREWTPELNHYHLIPNGFSAIYNPAGLAPGLLYEENNKILLCAPGVPKELRAMAQESWSLLLKEKYKLTSDNNPKTITIRTRGIHEEKIFSEIPDLWEKMSEFGRPSSLPQLVGIDLVIKLNSKYSKKVKEVVEELKSFLEKTILKNKIWQWGEDSLPDTVLKRARDKNLTIGLAESCTGGLLGKQLTDIPGCSDVFIGSVVSYHNNAKETLLDVPKETLINYGAVSSNTALAMAQGVFNRLHCDIGLSITGIAGPGGGTEDKPVGTVHMAVATKNKTYETHDKFRFYGERKLLRMRFAYQALFLLLEAIEEL